LRVTVAYRVGAKTTTAGLWIRVSTNHQEGDNQVPDLEDFAAHHGYGIATRYEVADSAWNGRKDNGAYKATLNQALDDAWAGKFNVLIFWALDRITREGAEGALRIIRLFRERGCTLVSVKESWLNGSPEIQGRPGRLRRLDGRPGVGSPLGAGQGWTGPAQGRGTRRRSSEGRQGQGTAQAQRLRGPLGT
jgi:hypothetical protein